MPRHLVNNLNRASQVALRDELVARLRLAESALLEKYPDAPPADYISRAVTEACLAGFGFCVEEVRTQAALKKAEARSA